MVGFRSSVGVEMGSLMVSLGSVNIGAGEHPDMAIWLPWTLTISG